MRDPLLATILAGLALAGCDTGDSGGGGLFEKTKYESAGCMAATGDTCPAPEDVSPGQLSDMNYCDYTTVEITATGTPEPQTMYGGDTAGGLYCCYATLATDDDPTSACAIGRPLLDDGEPVLADVPDGVCGVAADWLLIARMEHASVAAFHQLGLELMALAAPLDLLDAVAQAARDEVAHADGAFRLASRLAGVELRPGRMAIPAASAPDLVRLAASAAREGCVGETLGALLAREGARVATDPEAKALLERVAVEEARHAALSWRLVAWAIRVGGAEVREAVLLALREPPRLARFHHAPELGLLGPEATARLVGAGIREVLDPAARVLFAA